jgi:cyclopropane-fatty-acyl-phospholipid synthase
LTQRPSHPQNFRMDALVRKIEARLAGSPVPIALYLPSGERAGPAHAPVTLRFHDWACLATFGAGQIGRVAEDHVEGRLELGGAMRDIMRAAAFLLPGNPVPSDTGWWTHMVRRARSLAQHSPQRDALQIQFHYDVSDDFYALWLDPRRVYSCAYFADPGDSLAQAQEAKLDHICRKLMLAPGQRFLDIGAGWGALLLWAAEHYGVDATGITLSKNQHAHVNRLIEARGLQGRVRMELRDYRDLDESQGYDRIASVGMFEHVGSAKSAEYFATMRRLLGPEGRLLNHAISSVGGSRIGPRTFIGRYVFPDGELIDVGQTVLMMEQAGFEVRDVESLREHYAKTLRAWVANLQRHWDTAVADVGVRRARVWLLYMAASANGFEDGGISIHQVLGVVPGPDGRSGMPSTRSAWG